MYFFMFFWKIIKNCKKTKNADFICVLAEIEGFALAFCKAKIKERLMLCKSLRSAAKNSHTGLFFHPAGAALVRIPLINKTKKPFG